MDQEIEPSLDNGEGREEQTEERPEAEQARKKKLGARGIATIVVAAIVATGGIGYWYVNYQVPHNEAVASCNAAAESLESRNEELDEAIASLQEVLKSGENPLDPAVADAASAAIGDAQGAKEDVPDVTGTTEELNALAGEMESMGDYTVQLEALAAAQQNLENSIARLKQVTNPSEQFVIQRLTGLPNVTAIEAVTETNDPNGQLGKAGGYTSTVYFTSDLVNQAEVYLTGEYTPIVDAGCDGGGAIEVYANAEDAQKRNDYLASFDGSIFSSGSHAVVGSCLVRTSTHLTASQQQALQQSIIDSLIRLD